MQSLVRTVALAATLICADARADAAPADPETARIVARTAQLQAEAALITQQNALIAAKYGAAPTAPAGTISNPENFKAMGQWTLGAATEAAAASVSKRWLALDAANKKLDADAPKAVPEPKDERECTPKREPLACPSLLVTSVQDRRAAQELADILDARLASLTELLNEAYKPAVPDPRAARERAAPFASIAALKGIVGTLDSLVGLFRSDYGFSDISVTADDVALRIAVAHDVAVGDPGLAVTVDGLMGPGGKSEVFDRYTAFDTARAEAVNRYAKLTAGKSDAEKAKFADFKALLDAAAAFDAAITTPVAGQAPLVTAALAQRQSGKDTCVIYVKFGTYAASLVTRKHLLSRNDKLVAIAGGTAHMAFFDQRGRMVDSDLVRIDKRLKGRLSDVGESATDIGDVQTE